MVQRYHFDYNDMDSESMVVRPDADGDYVEYEDYAALEQRVKELEAALELANKRLEPIEEWWERSNDVISTLNGIHLCMK